MMVRVDALSKQGTIYYMWALRDDFFEAWNHKAWVSTFSRRELGVSQPAASTLQGRTLRVAD
jgi:hypothetical protein